MSIGRLTVDDTVFVSAAAGGVGSCAVQLAVAFGARVVGSAGSSDKVAMLTARLKAAHAFNYRDGDPVDLLRGVAPDGIDLYFDNVGGRQLEAAIDVLNEGGRAVICGGVAGYVHAGEPAGPRNYLQMIYKELTLRGFVVTAHEDLREEFQSEVRPLLIAKKIRAFIHTTVHGFDRIPVASGLRHGSRRHQPGSHDRRHVRQGASGLTVSAASGRRCDH